MPEHKDRVTGKGCARDNGQTDDVLGQWQRFVQGQPFDSPLRPLICESWLRCRGVGIDPDPDQVRLHRVPEDDLQQRLEGNDELLTIARPHLDWTSSALRQVPHIVFLIDRDGVVLYAAGNRLPKQGFGLVPGCDWSERTMGTNGAGTALAANQPVAIIGPEHYCRPFHDCTCLGAPLHAPDGSIIGAVDVSTSVADGDPERLLLVAHIAYVIDREIAVRDEGRRAARGREAAEAMRQNETQLQLMADALPALISFVDTDCRYQFTNAAYERWFGVPQQASRGLHMWEVLGEDAFQVLKEHVVKALAGNPQTFEARVPYRTAGVRDVHVDYIPQRDAEGRVTGFCVLVTDMTEQRQAENALKESQERVRLAVEATGMGVWFARMPNPSRYEWSPHLKKIWGLPFDAEVTPELAWSLLHPNDREEVRRAMERAVDPGGDGRFTVEHRVCRPDGTIAWVQAWGQTLFEGPTGARRPTHNIGVMLDITERRQVDEVLREREELIRLILNALTAHIAVLDGNGNIIAINSAWERFARSNGDLTLARTGVGVNYLDICRQAVQDDPDAAQVLGGLERVLEGSLREVSIEYPCHSPSEKRWFLMHVTPLSATYGGGVVVSHTSITRLKRVEAALRDSERRWRDLAEAQPQLVWTCTPDGQCDYLSRQWVAYTGKPEAEQLGYGWLEQVDPHDRDRLRSLWDRAIASGKLFDVEFRIRRADGAYRWFMTRAVPMRDIDGQVAKWFGSCTDIDDLRQATEALRESEERFRAFMNNTTAIAWMKDDQGRFIYLSKPFENHFGVRLEDWRGKTDFEVWPPPVAEEFRRSDAAVLNSNRPVETIEHTPTPDGGRAFWLVFKFPFWDASGQRYVGGIAIDITERKELEREVLEIAVLEQRRIGQELHDGVGQELTGLGLLADALAQRLAAESPARAAMAEKIVRGIGRVHQQVRSLSHGLVPVEVDPEGLRAALEDLVARTTESSGCACRFEVVGLVDVADPELATHLFRIAQEAVSNALRHGRARAIRIALGSEPEALTLRVEDDGVGIPDLLPEGKGLGLRLMRFRAGAIGGALSVTRTEGGGTVVTCRVPRGTGHANKHTTREQGPSGLDPHR